MDNLKINVPRDTLKHIKLLICCTKTKPYLSLFEEGYGEEIKLLYGTTTDKTLLEQLGVGDPLNGKIVAECDFEVEEIRYDWYPCNRARVGLLLHLLQNW